MSLTLHEPRRDEEGFSLIELMVVLVIFGIVGTIITTSLTRGVRASNQAQARIEAYEDMQIALERASRDVRGASTPLRAIEGADWEVGEGIEFERLLDGAGSCARFTYWVEGGALRVSEQRSTDGCSTLTPPATRILVPQLDNTLPGNPVFTFATYNEVGEKINIDDPDDLDDITIVRISLTRTLVGQQNATVRTDVNLRNAR